MTRTPYQFPFPAMQKDMDVLYSAASRTILPKGVFETAAATSPLLAATQ